MFNLGEYKEQDDLLKNQDVVSINDTFLDISDVHGVDIHDVNQNRAEIDRALFLAGYS